MFKEWQETYLSKYGSPFAAFMFDRYSTADVDEYSGSSSDGGTWVGRVGRRVMTEDGQGFADVSRYATEEEAREAYLELRTVELDALTEDGDELELPRGRKIRLRIQPEDMSVADLWSDDAYGKVAWIDSYGGPHRDYPQGAPRPDGFTGNAEKLHIGREIYWWEPPADVKRTDSQFDALRTLVREILEFGYQSIGLELLEGVDAYNRPIVADAQWLGGIEPSPTESYVAEIVEQLASEMDLS